MPLFDFECKCDYKAETFVHNIEQSVKCPKCNKKMKRLFPLSANCHIDAMLFPVEGIYLEHVSPRGRTFHSVGEMRSYAKKHNLQLGALL